MEAMVKKREYFHECISSEKQLQTLGLQRFLEIT